MSSHKNIVKLDIGGTIFKTTKSTLMKIDGMLKTMMETEIPIEKDDAGCLFIDRDPTHFRSILNFMRDGHVAISGTVEKLEEIQKEAKYYWLDDLVDLCALELKKRAGNSNSESAKDEHVKLNIGGTVFQTTKSTLTRHEGFFKTMLETNIPVTKDASGCIFIDRSAKHFDSILNFMRDGQIELPETIKTIRELRNEAQFYLLDGVAAMCKREIEKLKKLKTIFNSEVKVLETTGQVLQVTEKSDKPVLIIYYHVDCDGRFIRPDGLYIKSFIEKYKNRLDIYFKSFTNEILANSKGSPTVSWHWSLHKRGTYLYGYPQYNKNGDLKNGESFKVQLDNAIDKFLESL